MKVCLLCMRVCVYACVWANIFVDLLLCGLDVLYKCCLCTHLWVAFLHDNSVTVRSYCHSLDDDILQHHHHNPPNHTTFPLLQSPLLFLFLTHLHRLPPSAFRRRRTLPYDALRPMTVLELIMCLLSSLSWQQKRIPAQFTNLISFVCKHGHEVYITTCFWQADFSFVTIVHLLVTDFSVIKYPPYFTYLWAILWIIASNCSLHLGSLMHHLHLKRFPDILHLVFHLSILIQ